TIEVCTNSEDDDCDGEVNEGCAIAATNCQNGIQDEGEEGVDCGGVCENVCPQPDIMIPYLLILAGVGVFIVALILLVHHRRAAWNELLEKYKYAPAGR
ncbi:MAG: hypothetical protein KKA90_00010, partial [Nanoarchaeota archaeon]|nr:hypothetical protein [Nanoarchaeota archaeon]